MDLLCAGVIPSPKRMATREVLELVANP